MLGRLLPITRIWAAELCLSFDCLHFAFFFIYIEIDIKIEKDFRFKIRVISKSR